MSVSSRAMPRAPDCEKNPIRPRPGITGDIEALNDASTAVLMTPRQFGPMTRMPSARAWVTRSACRRCPSGPISAKPALMTTSPRTSPRAPHSAATSSAAAAGTATTARCTGSGMSLTVAYAGTPWTSPLAAGFTAYTDTGEAGGRQVPEQDVPGRARVAAGPDDSDRVRPK